MAKQRCLTRNTETLSGQRQSQRAKILSQGKDDLLKKRFSQRKDNISVQKQYCMVNTNSLKKDNCDISGHGPLQIKTTKDKSYFLRVKKIIRINTTSQRKGNHSGKNKFSEQWKILIAEVTY